MVAWPCFCFLLYYLIHRPCCLLCLKLLFINGLAWTSCHWMWSLAIVTLNLLSLSSPFRQFEIGNFIMSEPTAGPSKTFTSLILETHIYWLGRFPVCSCIANDAPSTILTFSCVFSSSLNSLITSNIASNVLGLCKQL